MKTVFWDCECGGLKSPFDQVICAAFKPYQGKPYIISRKPSDTTDKELCFKIKEELEQYDHLVTFNGLGYDKAFVSGRLLKHGLKPLKRQLHTDCYRIAKRLFHWTLHSLRLVVICEHLGIKGKTRVTPALWEQFKYDALDGKKKALDEIIKHCLMDVATLESAYDKCFKHEIVSISLR
jgi:uncharacterized protein YprB with RNaseH-like and TPR domain